MTDSERRYGPLGVWLIELSLFRGNVRMCIAAVVMSLVPAIYTLTYISSMWDPYGSLERLPVGMVEVDAGVEFLGQRYDIGREVSTELESKRPFALGRYPDREAAEAAVRSGEVYFAIVMPEDLSARAIPAEGGAQVEVITTTGTNYISAVVAERFAKLVVDQVNDRLDVERWSLVLSGLGRLSDAVGQLRDGAGQALGGATSLDSGARALHAGLAELAGKLEGIDVTALAFKGSELHGNTEKLAKGLARQKLLGKITPLPEEEQLERLARAADEYQVAVTKLAAGIEAAADGTRKLADGSARIEGGSGELASGLKRLFDGLSELAGGLPEPPGEAAELSRSVEVLHTDLAPVDVNGPTLVPFFMGLSVWLGAIVVSFLFQLAVYPRRLARTHPISKLAGKSAGSMTISVAAALLLASGVRFGLGIDPVAEVGLYVVTVVVALVFASVVFSFVRLLGDAGKLVSMLFLVLQLSAAGGVYPVEVSPEFFRDVSPYLPLTDAVAALRAAMFGSFDGAWWVRLAEILPWLLASAVINLVSLLRVRYVDDDDYQPALDIAQRKKGVVPYAL
ncbi:MAG: YhgE/Pip family protein [Myxococcota bacterium]|nr:YhgE/Pip family protein [Myxococcota bacterium]